MEPNPLILSAFSTAARGCAFMSYAVTRMVSGLSLVIVMGKVPSPSAEGATDTVNKVPSSTGMSTLRLGGHTRCFKYPLPVDSADLYAPHPAPQTVVPQRR